MALDPVLRQKLHERSEDSMKEKQIIITMLVIVLSAATALSEERQITHQDAYSAALTH